MLSLDIRTLLRQKEDRTKRHISAERRLGLGVDHRSRRVQKNRSLFGHVLKEDVGGVSTLPRARRDHLYRFGIWDGIELPLKRWFDRWMARGGKAIL